ncbi:MAG: ABC transporter ATP-binding protein [Xanthobacteraceae bacterium]
MLASMSPESAAAAAAPLLLDDITLDFRQAGGLTFRALDIPRLTIPPGALVAVTGPSGAGKTSFLHVIAGIALPTTGRVLWGEVEISRLPEARRDRWRRSTVGIVFQDFHLIPELDVLANILLPASFGGLREAGTLRARARFLAERVGLPKERRRVAELSRGEQQRVAIARALLRAPTVILADEPTASLDEANAAAIADLLVGSARESHATLIAVSHDPALIDRLDTRQGLVAGHLAPARPAP